MEIEPRLLTRDEQSVLDRLLSVEFAGVAELREQAEGAPSPGYVTAAAPPLTWA
jgi:hypothetical protein